jgi:hypothetical protein
MQAMDGMSEVPDHAELSAVCVIVAANHGGISTINYRFKDGQGNELSIPLACQCSAT